ncbi:MAG: hypothetical protein HYZ29_00130 [Myxococcales bacterium]|nr:hypothetical protein [Myxococcales bacterium]
MGVLALASPARAQGAASPAPFGPGAAVEVVSEGKPVNVFVARLAPGAALPPSDSDFVKVGKTPLTLQLPPGSYRIEVEGVEISNEAMLIEMRSDPRRIKVRTGSEGLATTGTLFMGLGILGVVGATAILASGSKAPSGLDKAGVLIPMYAAGAVCFGGGLAMSMVGSSKLEADPPAPPERPRGAWLGVRGTF